ncbi:MAG: phosphate acyltransferase PlsX [Gemmatimonadaceae bacterium]
MARIALDAMGGDHAPEAPIAAALLALPELDSTHTIQLVGDAEMVSAEIERQLAGAKGGAMVRDRMTIVDAPDRILMSDKPMAAIRSKPKSSMVVGLQLQADGASEAFVSAGSTGAQMAASTFILGRHAGLTRPAISTLFPTARQQVVMLDSGANVDCSEEELVDFARLGSVYAEDILLRPNPAVALLNIGEEREKGNGAVKKAYELLEQSDLNFLGNIEGRDILAGATEHGAVDVVVCDGFVGNVLLKFYESVPPLIVGLMTRAGVEKHRATAALQGFDYSDYGGAPLLGVKGVSIISHGESSPRALKNALFVALRAVESRMNEHIGRRLEAAHPIAGSGQS